MAVRLQSRLEGAVGSRLAKKRDVSVIVPPRTGVVTRSGLLRSGGGLTQSVTVLAELTAIRCVARHRPRIAGVT